MSEWLTNAPMKTYAIVLKNTIAYRNIESTHLPFCWLFDYLFHQANSLRQGERQVNGSAAKAAWETGTGWRNRCCDRRGRVQTHGEDDESGEQPSLNLFNMCQNRLLLLRLQGSVWGADLLLVHYTNCVPSTEGKGSVYALHTIPSTECKDSTHYPLHWV